VKLFRYSKFPQIEGDVSTVALKDYFKGSALKLLDKAEVSEITKIEPPLRSSRNMSIDSKMASNRTNTIDQGSDAGTSPTRDNTSGGYEIRLYVVVIKANGRIIAQMIKKNRQ
jgi:hypothetical protein